MRKWYVSTALAVALSGGILASEADFEQGLKALASKDWDAAINLMENALAGDADNIKYASEYRQAVLARAKSLHPKDGQPADFDRSLKFFEKLTADHPQAPNAFLNYGFAYVDKMPAAGAITQVILANTALSHFSKSIELKPTWIAYYTRGNSYLFWPKIFNRTHLGVADLQEAMKLQAGQRHAYYVRTYVALGDGYWKMDDTASATKTWRDGLALFPASDALKARLARQGDELKALIDASYDPAKRVDTSLRDLWSE